MFFKECLVITDVHQSCDVITHLVSYSFSFQKDIQHWQRKQHFAFVSGGWIPNKMTNQADGPKFPCSCSWTSKVAQILCVNRDVSQVQLSTFNTHLFNQEIKPPNTHPCFSFHFVKRPSHLVLKNRHNWNTNICMAAGKNSKCSFSYYSFESIWMFYNVICIYAHT